MDLTSVKTIKEIFAKYEARPSKKLGQNFLIDKNVLQKIIDAADLKPDDIVLEIGPGIGTLTQELAKRAGKVIAIEKDKKMCQILQETLNDIAGEKSTVVDFSPKFSNVKIINADVLKFDHFKLIKNLKLKIKNFKVVANIPYYLTSPLIRALLERPKGYPNLPEIMILMVQKEVAQRICAKPPDMNLLAVSVQFYAKPEIISYVSKNCFWPAPKVDSAIIKITPFKNVGHPMSPELGGHPMSPELFFKIVKAGFSQPRKQLGNNLSKMLKLTKQETIKWLLNNGIKPEQRAETLSIDDWINLTKSFE